MTDIYSFFSSSNSVAANDLSGSHRELRSALCLAVLEIEKLERGRPATPILKALRAILREAHTVGKKATPHLCKVRRGRWPAS